RIGTLNPDYRLRVKQAGKTLLAENLPLLRAIWSDVTRRIAALRDNPVCAESEYKLKLDPADPGITPKITFDLGALATKSAKTSDNLSGPSVANSRPAIAILREQGVNGQVEMAAAF